MIVEDPAAGHQLLLSILVPAYSYPEGVMRILTRLQSLPVEHCELIIFDDSPGDEIEGIVARWCRMTALRVMYCRNRPALGAASNWNALIDAARGEFCLLLHHDEFPLGDNFGGNLIAALRENPEADVWVLDCILVAPKSARNRRHLPTWLRTLVLNRFPEYLFRRNVIGPISAVVIRRSLYPRFDVRLQWLIDVELYVRLLKVTKRLTVNAKIQVGSILGRSDSITARLESSISQVATDERMYLQKLYPSAGIWLGVSSNHHAAGFLVRTCEAVCWNLMRLLTRATALVFPYAVSRSIVQQALHARPKL